MSKQMRKVRVGSVVRVRMDQTAVVEMVWKQRHRLYRKQMRRVARFYVHDPQNQCLVGDTIRIQETRPISKTKHWRLMDILQRRQLADIRPIDLDLVDFRNVFEFKHWGNHHELVEAAFLLPTPFAGFTVTPGGVFS